METLGDKYNHTPTEQPPSLNTCERLCINIFLNILFQFCATLDILLPLIYCNKLWWKKNCGAVLGFDCIRELGHSVIMEGMKGGVFVIN